MCVYERASAPSPAYNLRCELRAPGELCVSHTSVYICCTCMHALFSVITLTFCFRMRFFFFFFFLVYVLYISYYYIIILFAISLVNFI